MVARARQAGIRLQGLSAYYMEGTERCPENTVILGYASLPDRDIPALVDTLVRIWGPAGGPLGTQGKNPENRG